MLTASGSFALRTVAPPTRGREDEGDSLTGIKNELDKCVALQAKFRRLFGCKGGGVRSNPPQGIFYGIPHADTRSAADYVVAVERSFEGNCVEEVRPELFAEI